MNVHYSKVDTWLGVLVLGALAFGSVACAIAVLSDPKAPDGLVVLALLPWVVTAAASWPITYRVREDLLLIQSGLLRFKVPVKQITEVRESRCSLSAPAWSLDRLLIRYEVGGKMKSVMVSPQDKSLFLADLRAANSRLKVVAGGLSVAT